MVVPVPCEDQEFTVAITISITARRIKDLLCCAFEGGIGYWCKITGYLPVGIPFIIIDEHDGHPYLDAPFYEGGAVVLSIYEPINEDEPKVTYALDREAIKKGLKVMSEKYPKHFNNFVISNEDAITGDVFVQCCLFGEVIYS